MLQPKLITCPVIPDKPAGTCSHWPAFLCPSGLKCLSLAELHPHTMLHYINNRWWDEGGRPNRMGQLTQQEMTSCNDEAKVCIFVCTCTVCDCMHKLVHVAWTRGAWERYDGERTRGGGIQRDVDLAGFCYDGTISDQSDPVSTEPIHFR